jgi:hypothetical protein
MSSLPPTDSMAPTSVLTMVSSRAGRVGALASNTAASEARDLGLTEMAVRAWVKRPASTMVIVGVLPEREELAQVRTENRGLREERNSLEQETAFFGSESR